MQKAEVVQLSPSIVAFLFAHQDDEYPINARIRFEVNRGAEVFCIYLTDGEGHGVSSAIRNAESINVLTSYGVARSHIIFLGLDRMVHDGELMRHVDEIAARMVELLQPLAPRIEAIFAPAWEGGHPDHDAVHLVALDAANRIGAAGTCWEYPLYNGWGTRFFRVMKPLERLGGRKRKLSLSESAKSALQCWRYPSQLRTWAVLFPEALYRWLVLRCEQTARADATWIARRPHEGTLLYERLFNTSHKEFMQLTARIRERILSYRALD